MKKSTEVKSNVLNNFFQMLKKEMSNVKVDDAISFHNKNQENIEKFKVLQSLTLWKHLTAVFLSSLFNLFILNGFISLITIIVLSQHNDLNFKQLFSFQNFILWIISFLVCLAVVITNRKKYFRDIISYSSKISYYKEFFDKNFYTSDFLEELLPKIKLNTNSNYFNKLVYNISQRNISEIDLQYIHDFLENNLYEDVEKLSVKDLLDIHQKNQDKNITPTIHKQTQSNEDIKFFLKNY